MNYESKSEVLAAIQKLQISLLESGNADAAALVADGYSRLNGLNISWLALMEILQEIQIMYSANLLGEQLEELILIHACIKRIVFRV